MVAVPPRPLGSCSAEVLKGFSLSFPVPRQYRESQAFSFCTAGRWAAGEPVARDGTGLRGAWRRQIRQFSRVSPAVADAVVTAFPSPRLLQQVGPSLLKPLQVQRPSPQAPSHTSACP